MLPDFHPQVSPHGTLETAAAESHVRQQLSDFTEKSQIHRDVAEIQSEISVVSMLYLCSVFKYCW